MVFQGVTENYSDLSHLLGRKAHGLDVLAAYYRINAVTEAITLTFQLVAEKSLRAQVIGSSYEHGLERVCLLKPGFWLLYVQMSYNAGSGLAISISDNKALAEHGLASVERAFGIRSAGVQGLENIIIDIAQGVMKDASKGMTLSKGMMLAVIQ